MKTGGCVALASLAFCAAIAHAAIPTIKPNADLDRLVDAVVAYYHLPGIAVGVIDGGKVVYTHESGTLASGQPIDANTLFEIASNSKAMTSTLLARLVQQGKLRWDDPVT
jgi:CubicO group peptidase (beta-lactamase class C family)